MRWNPFLFLLIAACGTPTAPATSTESDAVDGTDAAQAEVATDAADTAVDANGCPAANAVGIGHVIVIIQENHTFDTYFGGWCQATPGSNPACTHGPACCERAPATEPSGLTPTVLDDEANANFDPNHHFACEMEEMDGGKMDKFVKGPDCADPRNFAVAPTSTVQEYLDLAGKNALADRYFQSIAGQSASNDMYFAVATKVFVDNAFAPDVPGNQCAVEQIKPALQGQTTIADLLQKAGKTVAWYGEGYADVLAAGTECAQPPADCPLQLGLYPCVFDVGDVPFLYYTQFSSGFVRDGAEFQKDLAAGTLPDVAYIKGLGYHTEHPGTLNTIKDGVQYVKNIVKSVETSCYKDNTLILLTWDEGGGFFDHIAPPPDSTVDKQPYGTRVPLLAIGRFAKKGEVSHVQMEHSSIVKFLEWNYLGGKTGQLNARDAVVNNIGSLLDPAQVGATVPSN